MCAGSERSGILASAIRVENTDNNISPPGERVHGGTSNDAETTWLQIPTKTYPDGFSHVSASVWRIKKRRSATDGRMERERGNGCTDERTGERFKEHPRTSSLFAKIALSAGKILLSQRATVNHRCESTKARLAAERKEGPITIDRATGKTASRRAARARWIEKEGGDKEARRRMLPHAKDALWDYGTRMAVSKFPTRNLTQVAPRICSANGKATLRSMGCSVNSQRYTSLPAALRSSSRKLIRLGASERASERMWMY